VVHTSHATFGYRIEAPEGTVAWAPEFLEFPGWAHGVGLLFAEAAGWERPIRFAGGVGGHLHVLLTARSEQTPQAQPNRARPPCRVAMMGALTLAGQLTVPAAKSMPKAIFVAPAGHGATARPSRAPTASPEVGAGPPGARSARSGPGSRSAALQVSGACSKVSVRRTCGGSPFRASR
jgi:hypothetical protein